MLLGSEINNLLSRLFSASEAKAQDAYNRRAARNEYNKPLMQIVETRVSQRQKEERALSMTGNRAFAAEVGPPPLTNAAFHR